MPGTRRLWISLGAVAFLLAASLGSPGAAHAGNVPTSISSTFELLPESHVIRVTVVHTVTNRIASTTSGNVITNYFINESSFSVDPLGVNYRVSVTGGSARISVSHKAGFLSTATVTFPAIYNGQSRTITAVYDIPSGAPRSGSTYRAGLAYGRFCGFPGGVYPGDPETLRLIVPERFEVEQVYGAELALAASGGKHVFTRSGTTTEGTDAGHGCVEAIDEAAFVSADHTSPGGIQVTTKNWPEDTEWQQSVAAQVGPTLDALEAAIGRAPDAKSLIVEEVIAEELSGYAGEFDPDVGLARVSEDALDPLVAAHELAHAWFNDEFTIENWLWEGYAEYYGRLVTDTAACSLTEVAATGAEADLANWGYLPAIPTEADNALVDAQYATACWVVTEVARKIGDLAMQEIIAASAEDEIPYLGDGPAEEHHGELTWRKWLDLADERGLVPAGETDLDWLQELLVQYGAATGADTLEDRSTARAAYHQLLGDSDPWSAPIAIRQPISHWEFDDATAAIEIAAEIDATHDASVELVPELAEGTEVQDSYEAAEVSADLEDALRVAEHEAEAAAAVADAVTASEAGRNPVEAVGLIGDDLAADAEAAVDQLVAGDLETATATADATTQAGANAALSGGLRIGVVLLVAVAIFGGVVFWRRRTAGRMLAVGDGEELEGTAAPLVLDTAEDKVVKTDVTSDGEPPGESAEAKDSNGAGESPVDRDSADDGAGDSSDDSDSGDSD